MKLYAYMDRRTAQVALAKFDVTNIGEHVIGTIEVTEPGTHKASEVEWSDGNIEYQRLSNRHDDTYKSGFRSAEIIFAPKKTVTKEAIKVTIPIFSPEAGGKTFTVRLDLPTDAKNIHCTYEVEE